jgi:Helix-turn-helix domain
VRSAGEILGSRPARHRYCRCGTHLAADNPGRQCARCQRASRNKLIAPPHVPPEFWQTEQLDDAFAAQHIGRVARAYRMHPYYHTVYGPSGISRTLLGQWLGLRQSQISRIETGSPIPNLDTLVYWARYCGFRQSCCGSNSQTTRVSSLLGNHHQPVRRLPRTPTTSTPTILSATRC